MAHRIQSVVARENLMIEAVFYNGEVVQYDIKQLFSEFPQFRILQTMLEVFEGITVDAGGYGVVWNDDLDLDAETIWEDGVLIETLPEPSLNHLLAYQLILAREKSGITQKELSERTGIYQADISKLERGLGNPSISTLKRLADGMGMELRIDFVTLDK